LFESLELSVEKLVALTASQLELDVSLAFEILSVG
jgi:hypothetical protein